MTTLTLTPNFTAKTLTAVGVVAVGESVAVSVVGVSEAQSANLRVRVRYDKVNVAIFPRLEGESWTWATSTATGTIELNTVQFREVFVDDDDRATHDVIVIVENTSDQNMYAEGRIRVKNWPADEGDGVPYNLSGYQDTVEGLAADLALLQVSVDGAVSTLGSHKHDGGTSVKVSHDDLLAKGTLTHAQIDSAITSVQESQSTVSGETAALRTDFDQIKVICETVKLMPTSTAAQREARMAVLLDGIIASLT